MVPAKSDSWTHTYILKYKDQTSFEEFQASIGDLTISNICFTGSVTCRQAKLHL